MVGDGVESFQSVSERIVAAEAYDLAHQVCMESPASRALYPAVRVVEVEERPGSCLMFSESDLPRKDYYATVRAYGVFGLYRRTFEATCGGIHVTCR